MQKLGLKIEVTTGFFIKSNSNLYNKVAWKNVWLFKVFLALSDELLVKRGLCYKRDLKYWEWFAFEFPYVKMGRNCCAKTLIRCLLLIGPSVEVKCIIKGNNIKVRVYSFCTSRRYRFFDIFRWFFSSS